MNVILLGYRGSGKTSIGRKLAARLGMVFVDVDTLVRQRFGDATIAQIWQRYGELRFREEEVQVTRELCGGDGRVIALGGGTVMQPGGRRAVEQAAGAVRIYLSCQADELHRRIHGDRTTASSRPALTEQGGGIEEIEAVLERRDPVYRAAADHVVEVTQMGIDQVVERLVAKVL